MKTNNITEQYINDIKNAFAEIPNKDHEDYLKSMIKAINEHANEFPDSSYQDYIDSFGKPEEIMESYIETKGTDYVVENMKHKKLKSRIFKAVLAILVLVLIISVIFIINAYNQNEENMFDHSETVITED